MDWETIDEAGGFIPGAMEPVGDDHSPWYISIAHGRVLAVEGVIPWRPLSQEEFTSTGLTPTGRHFIGHIGRHRIYACQVEVPGQPLSGFGFVDMMALLGQVSMPLFHILGRARQIIDWDLNHRFCGACGRPTRVHDRERSRVCDCGQIFYPRLSPSIIVLVTRGEHLLLARNVRMRARRWYSTLAGFVEPGETIEDAVHREVFEEVGVRVKNLRYYRSQPWPFPNSLMLGFYAEFLEGEIRLQPEEIDDARWFHYKELPPHPGRMSIAGHLIGDYVQSLKETSDPGGRNPI